LCLQAYDQWEAEEAAAAQQLIKQQQKAKARGKAAAKGAKGGKGKKAAATPWSDDEDDGDDDVEMMDSEDEFVVSAEILYSDAWQLLMTQRVLGMLVILSRLHSKPDVAAADPVSSSSQLCQHASTTVGQTCMLHRQNKHVCCLLLSCF
jgi:hypothetical protein